MIVKQPCLLVALLLCLRSPQSGKAATLALACHILMAGQRAKPTRGAGRTPRDQNRALGRLGSVAHGRGSVEPWAK